MNSVMKFKWLGLVALICLIAPLINASAVEFYYEGRVLVDGLPYNGTGYFKFAIVSSNGSITYWSNEETSVSGCEPLNAINIDFKDGISYIIIDDPSLPFMSPIDSVILTKNENIFLRIWYCEDGKGDYVQICPDVEITHSIDHDEILNIICDFTLPHIQKSSIECKTDIFQFESSTSTLSKQNYCNLLVSSRSTNSILQYDGSNGAFQDVFISPGYGGLNAPYDMVFGPDGNLYIASNGSHSVLRYDSQTGVYIDTFVTPNSGGLKNPWDLAFGPNGDLYVSSPPENNVLRYSGTTGEFINSLSSAEELDNPTGIAFGPNGDLFVCSHVSDSVLHYDGETGQFLGIFIPGKSGELDGPMGLVFGTDGNLYVGSANTDSVLRYNGDTGDFIDTFVESGSGGLDEPTIGLIFGPDNNLYTSSALTHGILRYNGQTGQFLDSFISSYSGGLISPRGIIFRSRLNVVISAYIEPAAPRTTDDLKCITTLDNNGNYSEFSWSYRWFENGEELLDGVEINDTFLSVTEPSLSNYFTSKNETFFCVPRITSGTLYLETTTSPVTVINSTPTAPVIGILPENPTPDSGLSVWIVEYSTDADGDNILYLFDWFESSDGINWNRRSELSSNPPPNYERGEPEISRWYTQAAEYWQIKVTPFEIPGKMKSSITNSKSVDLKDIIEGESKSHIFFILPDLTRDGIVNTEDLLLIQSVWHKRKMDINPDIRVLFFEAKDENTKQIGIEELLRLTQSWYWDGN